MNVPESRFIPLTEPYLETVRAWRNSPRVSNNMLTNDPISSQQQKKWFDNLRADPARRFFLFLQNDRPVGILNFVDITAADCSWGCYLGEENIWPGSGLILEIAALDYAFDHLLVKTLKAEVLAFNQAPQKMHKIFGFTQTRIQKNAVERDGCQHSLIHYEYSQLHWQQQRQAVLKRLPKQIGSAAERIHFHHLPETS